jgi:translation initiation factor 2 subunit 2
MNDYLASLDRAQKQLPEIKGSGERFVVPEPKLLTEGKTTVLENFAGIADRLNREPEHIFKFLLRELGTAGKIDGSRAIFQKRFTTDAISELINAYVKEYVICSECGRPDTHLIKSERILTLRCDACGAHRPVTKRRAVVIKEEALTEGETYEVRIDAVGSKGDGIAKKDKYTIYVPNAAKGDVVKIKIKKITGNLAFAEFLEKIS